MPNGSRRIVAAVCGTPWAIEPAKLEAIAEFLQLRASGIRFTKREVQARIGAASGRAAPSNPRGIAILPLYGVLSQRVGMLTDYSGGTSTEGFGAMFDQAMADPSISAICIDIDSPGGNVEGVPELYDKILGARGGKPIVAIANSLAASAAYWVACACDEIVVTPSGSIGSIGVLTVHVDTSAADAEAGISYTVVSAGDYKAEGVYEPLGADAKAALQDRVNTFYGMFVRAVAKGRGVGVPDVRGGFGQGRVVTAAQAIELKMADRIATLDDTIARLGGRRGANAIKVAAMAGDPIDGLELPPGKLALLPDALVPAALAAGPLVTTGASSEDRTPTVIPVLDPPAQQAKETPMAAPAIPVPTPGADPNELKAELARLKDFNALKKEHPLFAEQIDGWLEAGQSVDFATRAIRKDLQAQLANGPTLTVGKVVVDEPNEAKRPFASFGEQMVAVVQAGLGTRTDPRLHHANKQALKAAVSGMNESIGSEGGFFIAPELLPGVIEPIYTDDPIISRVARIPMGGNAVKYNVIDETSRATGSRYGGIQAYWAGEADTATAKKPKLRQMELALKKIIAIGYLTDELMQDAPAAEALLTTAFQKEIAFMLGDAIFRGTGAGQPLGFLSSNAVVSVAIEGSQTIANTASSIATNVSKMMARIPASLWGELIWLYNQELLPKLITATIGSSGQVPVFMTVGGLANRPQDTILGRPAFASELCEAEGTAGDIIAIAPSQYHLADKGGPQAAQSVHVRFLNDENTLRITYRTDGHPVWTTAITRFKGGSTLSPFVTLAARS